MKSFYGIFLFTVVLLTSACSGGTGNSNENGIIVNSTPDSLTSVAVAGDKSLAGVGVAPDFTWHDNPANGYKVGAHASFGCGNCHTVKASGESTPKTEICSQCHGDKYFATTNPSHVKNSIPTYCNSCHFSDSFTSHSRANHKNFHWAITTNCTSCHVARQPATHTADGRTSGCESCHQYSSGKWVFDPGTTGTHSYTSGCESCHSGKKPATHTGIRTSGCESCHAYPDWSNVSVTHNYTSGCSSCHLPTMPAKHYGTNCESCHTYPNWSAATFNHSGIRSGCASCHSKHFSGYACEWCHTSGINWQYSHSRVNNKACTACHTGGGGDDDGGGDDSGGGGGGDDSGGSDDSGSGGGSDDDGGSSEDD